MDEILNHVIIQIIKEVGYESASKKAILLLADSLKDQISSILKVLHCHTSHTSRQNSNMWNLLEIMSYKYLIFQSRPSRVYYPISQEEPLVDFKSPLSTYLERYIHIYDFMPPFPPTHTFRQTLVKNKEKEDKSELVKTRLEQSLRSERNLLKLIKSSGSLPSFVNYLYKK
ncbi:transcription initiation factor TFIID subunit 8 (TAF8) [Vairimorpha necatrix]|uniref:Transcription initiation factor TFIID subunit 8 n=1 Tax=Vairimorpha necatrix TaxID=6039 RepID=A0AAX4J8U7_9MICR